MRTLACLALVACSSNSTSKEADSRREHYGTGDAKIEVTSAGAEPRMRLAYQPRTAKTSAQLAFQIAPAGVPPEIQNGATLTLDWSSGSPSTFVVSRADGIIPADAKDVERKMIAAIWRAFERVAGRVAVDARGRAKLARTDDRLPTQPSVLYLVHAVIVPLPAEPIGLGATWHAVEQIEDATLDRTYELIAPNTVRVGGGTKSDDGELVVSGSITLDLEAVLPRSAELDLRHRVTLGDHDLDSLTRVRLTR